MNTEVRQLFDYDQLLDQIQAMQGVDYAYFNVFRQQTLSDRIYEAHMGKLITRPQFYDLNDLFVALMPDSKFKTNLLERMDDRTGGQFAADMLENTLRETFLAREVERQFPGRLCESISFEDNGCDNTGKVRVGKSRNAGNADFIAYSRGFPGMPDGKRPCEMKFDCKMDKATFKLFDLLSYSRQDAYVFLVFTDNVQVGGNGCREEPPAFKLPPGKTYWTVFGPDVVQKLLKLPMSDRYGAMGNKTSCRVWSCDFPKFFDIKRWPE